MQKENHSRVLVVSDHERSAKQLSQTVEELGYDVTAAAEISDALRLSHLKKFKLVIIDVEIKKQHSAKELFELFSPTPVAFVPRHSQSELKEQALYEELTKITKNS